MLRTLQLVRRITTVAAITVGFAACSGSAPLMPQSHQAQLMESINPQTVRVAATGIGKEFAWAVDDAKKAAISHVAESLVQSRDEQAAWEMHAPEVYKQFERYIVDWELKSRLKAADDNIEVRGEVIVNREGLADDLVAANVVSERREILSELSHPTIAVLPDDGNEGRSWTKLAANRAGSFLTQRKYDVIDLEQLRRVEKMSTGLRNVDGIPSDPKAMIALQAGADVYIVFDVQLDEQSIGSDRTVKASASMKAFETTTARQVGTATGFSKAYAKTAGAADKAVAEAIGDAVDSVLSNIDDYWKDDIDVGQQFLLTISGQFGADNRQARRTIHRALRQATADLKETLATDRTLNYRVWASGSATDLLFTLQDEVEAALPGYRLEEVTSNRKLLVLELTR